MTDTHEPHSDTIAIPAPGVAEAHPAVADAVDQEINFDEAFYPARPRALRPRARRHLAFTGTLATPFEPVATNRAYVEWLVNHSMLGDAKTLARLFGLPYFPLTPTFPWLGPLGAVPLPSKWVIEFGEPIETAEFGDGAAEDPMLVFEITDQVRETIQHNLYRMLVRRRGIFR